MGFRARAVEFQGIGLCPRRLGRRDGLRGATADGYQHQGHEAHQDHKAFVILVCFVIFVIPVHRLHFRLSFDT